jgi:hypothetical protein
MRMKFLSNSAGAVPRDSVLLGTSWWTYRQMQVEFRGEPVTFSGRELVASIPIVTGATPTD